MFATILTLIVVSVIVYLLKRKSDKEIAKADADRAANPIAMPPGNNSGGNAGGNLQPGDPGYDAAVDTAKGAAGYNQPQ